MPARRRPTEAAAAYTSAGVREAFPGLPDAEAPDRLGLAAWEIGTALWRGGPAVSLVAGRAGSPTIRLWMVPGNARSLAADLLDAAEVADASGGPASDGCHLLASALAGSLRGLGLAPGVVRSAALASAAKVIEGAVSDPASRESLLAEVARAVDRISAASEPAGGVAG